MGRAGRLNPGPGLPSGLARLCRNSLIWLSGLGVEADGCMVGVGDRAEFQGLLLSQLVKR